MLETKSHNHLKYLMGKAFADAYNQKICKEIYTKVCTMPLPLLDNTKIIKCRDYLEKANKKYPPEKNKETKEKFTNLIEAFRYIHSQTPDDPQIQQIIQYINEFKHLEHQIERQTNYKITMDLKLIESLVILKPTLDHFIGRYGQIIEKESETTDFDED